MFRRISTALRARYHALFGEKKPDAETMLDQLANILNDLEIKQNDFRVMLARITAKTAMMEADLVAIQEKRCMLEEKQEQHRDPTYQEEWEAILSASREEEAQQLARLEAQQRHEATLNRDQRKMNQVLQSLQDQKDRLEARLIAAQSTRETFEYAGRSEQEREELEAEIIRLEAEGAAALEMMPDALKWDIAFNDQIQPSAD